ncbi:hypothetical protein L7F22_026654 [Adiantum nelumboides]|nr:hypothetical protein [Adiantum nelumboides]
MGRPHDRIEQQQRSHRNEDFGSAPSSLARYQSATFSSAAQDRRFLCISPSRPLTVPDAPPSSRVLSNRHKSHAGNESDVLCNHCKCGGTLDISCPWHGCVVGQSDLAYNHMIAADVAHMRVSNRCTRPLSMSPYSQIDPLDFSLSRSGREGIANSLSCVALVKHRSAAQHKTMGEDFHYREKTILPSCDKPQHSAFEGKAFAAVCSDGMSPVRNLWDRRQHPGHRVSFDGGIWPASNVKLSALTRFENSLQGDKPSTLKEEKGTYKKTNSPVHASYYQQNISASDQCEVLLQGKVAKPLTLLDSLDRNTRISTCKQGTNEFDYEVRHAVNSFQKNGRMENLKERSMNSHEKEKAKAVSLGKHLGEHFQNLNTSAIHQLVKSANEEGRKPEKPLKPKKKNEAAFSTTTLHRREQGENLKPFENLNSKLDYKLHSILEVPSPKGTFPSAKKTPSSTSLREAVASLLTPNRHKNHSSKKEDKSRGPLLGLSRSASHSMWSPFSSTGMSAKVARSISMDGREASLRPRGLKGGNKNLSVPERSCRSYDGINSNDSSGCIMSDTESASFNGSMSRPRELSSQSLLTDGDVATSPASFNRQFLRHSSEIIGDVKTPSQRRLSLTVPKAARDGTSKGRRWDSNAAIDFAILNNRYLQWRFLNASMKIATRSQVFTAESLLLSACINLFQLRTSVTTKQVTLNKAGLGKKLSTIVGNSSPALKKWDMVQQDYFNSVNKVVSALEAAVVHVPLHGAHVTTQSLKGVLNSGAIIMAGMDSSIAKLLQQVGSKSFSTQDSDNIDILKLSNISPCLIYLKGGDSGSFAL